MSPFKTILTLAFLGLGLCSCAQEDSAVISEKVKKSIRKRVESGTNPGIVLGVIDEQGVRYFSYGLKSLNTRDSVNEQSVFEIGSISKTFTGILLADLVLKGELSLNDPVQNLLPDGINAPTRNGEFIQLVHMSNHTSGLPRMPDNFRPSNPGNPYIDYTEKQLYDFINGHELRRDIGATYEYSNYAQGLLGHLLAKKQNSNYETLMQQIITKLLEMNQTAVILTPQMQKELAYGHSRGRQVENWDIPTLAGAGAIRSTAADMLKYLEANTGLKESSLYPAMQLSHKNSRVEGSTPIVGLGWHTMVFDDAEIVWHNGGTGGYRAFAGFIKGGKKGVVVLTNSDVSVDDIGIHLLHPSSRLRD
ncbi:MAG: beta-lactamase family protein [Roseivirga sp.]|nr:beta-lactamase family protein [Roseivirga sp.]